MMKKYSGDGEYAIDAEDRAIISALKEDPRMPFSRIADRLDVSRGMVRGRLESLLENDVLKIVAITNPFRLGYNTMALIGVNADVSRLQDVAERIAEFEETVYVVICAGPFDLLIEVFCRNKAHLLEFLTKSLHSVDGVEDSQTFMYLDIVKEVYF